MWDYEICKVNHQPFAMGFWSTVPPNKAIFNKAACSKQQWYAELQAITFLSPSQLAGCGPRVIFCPCAFSQPRCHELLGARARGTQASCFSWLPWHRGESLFSINCWTLWFHQHRCLENVKKYLISCRKKTNIHSRGWKVKVPWYWVPVNDGLKWE